MCISFLCACNIIEHMGSQISITKSLVGGIHWFQCGTLERGSVSARSGLLVSLNDLTLASWVTDKRKGRQPKTTVLRSGCMHTSYTSYTIAMCLYNLNKVQKHTKYYIWKGCRTMLVDMLHGGRALLCLGSSQVIHSKMLK